MFCDSKQSEMTIYTNSNVIVIQIPLPPTGKVFNFSYSLIKYWSSASSLVNNSRTPDVVIMFCQSKFAIHEKHHLKYYEIEILYDIAAFMCSMHQLTI